MSHIKSVHRVSEEELGCSDCGLVTKDRNEMRSHQLETYGAPQEFKKARIALAHFSRKLLIKSDPSMAKMPKSVFWERGGRKYDTKSQGKCLDCNQVITPWTQEHVLQHYSEFHQIIVDLDFEQLHDRHRKYNFKTATQQEMGIGSSILNLSVSDDEEEYSYDDRDANDTNEFENDDHCDHLSETTGEGEYQDWNHDNNEAQDLYCQVQTTSQDLTTSQPTPSSTLR